MKPATTKGVRVSDINEGNATFDAWLRDDDVLTKMGEVAIVDVATLVKTIRDRRPGDVVDIEFLRNGKPSKVSATLAGRDALAQPQVFALPNLQTDNNSIK